MLPLRQRILLMWLHATHRVKQDGQSAVLAETLLVVLVEALSVVLAKALVPSCLGMLAGLLLTLHTNLTHSAAQREVGDVCELPGLMTLQSEGSAYEMLLKPALCLLRHDHTDTPPTRELTETNG